MSTARNRRGFSLLELVIVVMIIGIIAAIAIPRMSRGSAGAADSALSGNLAVLRNAIDLYAAEHGGSYPALATVASQLTQYTSATGDAGVKDNTRIYGPYLRQVPPLPVNCPRKNATGISDADAAGIGWIYNATTGEVRANTTTEADATGKLYKDY